MPVAALVRAGELFGLAEGSIRVATHRLLADGRLERDERGHYRLGAAAAPVQSRVAGWRELESRTRRWDGHWLAVQRAPRALRNREGRAALRALRWLGFETLSPGLALRPANLAGGANAVRETLGELGLPREALVFALHDLDADHDARARGLWDRAALERGYRSRLAELEKSRARLAALPEERAMVESFRVGGRVLRQLVLDPLLPEPLIDVAARRALVEAMRDYDRLGRDAWAAFLGRFGVPHRSAPTDTRWASAEDLAQSA